MKQLLVRLFEHQYLGREEAREILRNIAEGQYKPSQVAAFMTVFMMRSISLDEIIGFRQTLLEMCQPVDLADYDPIDIVGTGGDNKNTFNISTAACFVVAGAGYHVCKQGNYSSTSISGASNVIEQYGVKFTNDIGCLRRSIEKCKLTYLHAQYFHPALKTVAPIRKELKVPTFFYVLGPLVNPMRPKKQVLGVSNLKMARLYSYIYQQEDIDFSVVHSLDGYDEIALTGPFKVITNKGDKIYTPKEYGFASCTQKDLYGGDTPKEAALIFDNVLHNRGTVAQQNVVMANAAIAIRLFDANLSLAAAIDQAKVSIESGASAKVLKQFVELNS